MGRFRHFCTWCKISFLDSVDYVFHHNEHIKKGKLKEDIFCKQCGGKLDGYHRDDSNWDIIGEDDRFVHGEW